MGIGDDGGSVHPAGSAQAGPTLPVSTPVRLVLFRLGARRFALPLVSVERALRAVEVVPLPGAPAIVTGVVSVHGRLLPVLDLRRRFGLPAEPLGADHWFLIAHAGPRDVILTVDECEDVVERPQHEVVPPAGVSSGLERFAGLIDLGGLVLIHDLETFLSPDEDNALDRALAPGENA